jgi:osmotically-inducible protein OsmY
MTTGMTRAGVRPENPGQRAGRPRSAFAVGRGGYSGRGPKNYQKADTRIREEICEELTRNDEVDASEVQVEVEHGVVRLQGKVEDRRQRRLAEEIADSCFGVRDLQNDLEIDPGFFART